MPSKHLSSKYPGSEAATSLKKPALKPAKAIVRNEEEMKIPVWPRVVAILALAVMVSIAVERIMTLKVGVLSPDGVLFYAIAILSAWFGIDQAAKLSEELKAARPQPRTPRHHRVPQPRMARTYAPGTPERQRDNRFTAIMSALIAVLILVALIASAVAWIKGA